MKKILMSVMTIGIAVAFLGAGTFAYFSDIETSVGNTFTAGTIDISLNTDGGQQVVTVDGDLDLKPCQTGYITVEIHNDGNNPCEVWKHIANVVNRENGKVEPEREYYNAWKAANPDWETDGLIPPWDWLISDWIHYDLIACKPIIQNYDTYDEAVEATVVKEWACCTTTWTVDIISDNVPHGVYGVGLAISLDGTTPDYQVFAQEYAPYAWLYQEYPWSENPTIAIDDVDWITVNARNPEDKHFEISIDCEYLGGEGATYYWAMQLKTNLITWLGVYDWGASAAGFLVNHVGTYDVEILESEGFYLTEINTHFGWGVQCKWIYLGVLQPCETMIVKQSYHLDATVDNWGQSDKVVFDMEFFAQQIEGDPLPPPPGDVLSGHGR